MKFIDLFSGIGGFRSALEKNGHECVGFAEIDKFAIQSYKALYDTEDEIELGDISKISDEDIAKLKEEVDVVVGGSPCFRAGTLISTKDGLKPIEEVKKGDEVLTHENRFRKVVMPMITHADSIYKLRTMNSVPTYVTEEHPFLVVERTKKWKDRKYIYEYSEPTWVKTKDLVKNKHFIKLGNSTNGIKNSKDFVEINGELFTPIRELEKETTDELVYNFEVEEDNSYVANNLVAHNCQSFSIAGNRGGFDDTRGTLFFEYARTIKDIQPKYFIFENVKGMLSHDKGNTIRTVLNTFNDLGYYIDFNVFNSKFYDVPQNRERIYIVGKRKDLVSDPKFHESKKRKIKLDEVHNWAVENIQYVNLLPELKTVVNKRLVDILEDEVDEKFFLDEEKTERLLERIKNKEIKNNFNKQVADYRYDEGLRIREEGISPCLTANLKSMGTDNKDLSNAVYVIGSTQKNAFIGNGDYSPALTSAMGIGGGHVPMVVGESNFDNEEPKITVVGNTSNTGHRSQDVHDVNGIIPTIAARDYKGPKQIIIDDTQAFDGVRTYEEITPTLRANRQGLKVMVDDNSPTTEESEIDYYAYDDVVISEHVAKQLGEDLDIHYAYLDPSIVELEDGLKLIINNEATQAELLQATEDKGVYISLGVYTDTNNEITSKESFGRFGKQAIETLTANLDVAKYGDTINAFNRTLDSSGVSPTLTTRPDGFKTAILPITKEVRIRKLTPRECWRLQSFTDDQFDKAQQAGLSDSQLYKQAGNAVTVNVVDYIAKHLLID